MKADDVTRRQACTIRSNVEPIRDYLFRLRTRMSDRGFQPEDPLYVLVKQAELAISELFIDVEYRARCGPVDLLKPSPMNELDRRTGRKHERR